MRMTLAGVIVLPVNLRFIKTKSTQYRKIRQHGKVALINVAQTLNCNWGEKDKMNHTHDKCNVYKYTTSSQALMHQIATGPTMAHFVQITYGSAITI